uniref:Uncharacterized protein n=1 Tax=Ciona intestinalis TaxID=7719 RepID=H2XXR9_CIOIN
MIEKHKSHLHFKTEQLVNWINSPSHQSKHTPFCSVSTLSLLLNWRLWIPGFLKKLTVRMRKTIRRQRHQLLPTETRNFLIDDVIIVIGDVITGVEKP